MSDVSASTFAGELDEPEPPKPRRHRVRVILLVLLTLLALVVGCGAVAYLRLDSKIKTFSPTGLSKHRPPPTVHGQNLLLIGSDSRNPADAKLGGKGSAVGRSDTTLFLHIYEGGKRAVGVSIPRDSLVDIPPCLLPDGSWSAPQPGAMFNEAYSVGQTPQGNPACTVNTVEKMTGMRVDHTLVADFAGFAKMTEIVGGVPVCLPHPVYEGDLNPNLPNRGKMIFKAGVQTVAGQKALNYVRIRHGIGDGSDIGRMRRQQAFLSAVITKVRDQGLTPTKVWPIAQAATENLTVDPGLGTAKKLVSFVLSLKDLQPSDIQFLTTPWRYDGARVALVHPDVDQLWAALRADQPLTAKPGDSAPKVTVEQALKVVKKTPVDVLNGTTVTGLAARTAARLKKLGLTIGKVDNARASTYRRTVVEYGSADAAAARALAAAVPGVRLEPSGKPGLRLVLGTRHRLRQASDLAVLPKVKLPASVTSGTRSAGDNPCVNISYGADSAN